MHRPLPIRAPQPDLDRRDELITQDVTLDPDYYERGVAARKQLGDIASVFDEVENQADTVPGTQFGIFASWPG